MTGFVTIKSDSTTAGHAFVKQESVDSLPKKVRLRFFLIFDLADPRIVSFRLVRQFTTDRGRMPDPDGVFDSQFRPLRFYPGKEAR
jgi:hypothetical protein